MIKAVILLQRREDWSFEEFREYWEDEHAPLVEEMPNVRRYVTSLPTNPEKAAYDGIAELYFDDMGALGEAFESEAGQRIQADADEFTDQDAGVTLFVEETVQFDDSE